MPRAKHPGTRRAVRLRAARPADVPAIVALSRRYAAQDLLLHRTRDRIEAGVGEFLVAVDAEGLLGCVGLSRRPQGLLVYNLCVAAEAQGQGIGALLVDRADRIGAEQGCALLIAASKHSGAWFVRRGFIELTPRRAPCAGPGLAPPDRGSRLYVRPVAGYVPPAGPARQASVQTLGGATSNDHLRTQTHP
ncbi:GNAT family N-acetyltransferase [Streptomyces sp. NPDC001108]